ncbi:MAG: type IV pilus secretin PilQ [Desulfuromonadaceae bacterium]|nr:type IV pilus secretin PilQ [Desulfuromonadaceae bacterium]
MKWMTKTSVIASVAFTMLTVFTVGMPGRAESAQEARKPKLASIKSISSSGQGDSTELVIVLSSPVTYTSYKTTSPLRLIIDLSQTTPGAIEAPVPVNRGNFKTVTVSRYDTDAGVLSRMNIELLNDAEAVISASPANPGELRISFPATAETAAPVSIEKNDLRKPAETETKASSTLSAASSQAAPMPTADAAIRRLKSITANNSSIILTLDGAVGDFKTFRLAKPERYVVDLMDVTSGLETRLLPLNVAGVASARIGIYPDKVRVVFDPVNGSFPEAIAVKADSAVVITLGGKPANVKPSFNRPPERAEAAAGRVPAQAEEKPALPKAESKEVPAAADVPTKVSAKAVNPAGSEEALVAAPPEGKRKPAAIKSDSVEVPSPAALPTRAPAKAVKYSGPSIVEMIDFQVVDGISRVSVKLKGDVSVDPPVKSPGFVTLIVKNASLPKTLQRSLDAHSFISPVLRVTPLMVKKKKGNDTKILIAMRVDAPLEFRHEGDMLFVDFKNPEGLTADKLANETNDLNPQASKPKASVSGDAAISAELEHPQTSDSNVKAHGSSRSYTGRKVTLEFADADVRKIFQLLAEVSGKNFVLGDDVSGNISLKLVNVPWDQAFAIILETKDLDSREDGNVLTIKKKGKFKSQADEELEIKKTLAKGIELKTETFSVNYSTVDEIAGQFEKLKTSDRGQISKDARTNKVIVKDTPQALDDMRNLLAQLDVPERQVMIEARIVEASSTFTRNLGVNWGMHYRDGSAAFLGINQMDTSFGGLATAAPTTGASGQAGAAMGISFGTLASNISIDLRLNAAASAGLVKIISSPKVATLNHKTAKISQGQQIPYQNTTATTGAVTAFVAATLSLEVTPHINANGTIVMKIEAKNDAPGTGSPPPINTKQATTELLLKDGETTVIGGIFVDSETDGDEGVPYLMDVPLLGNLFKSNAKSKTKTELLIFITPRILGGI